MTTPIAKKVAAFKVSALLMLFGTAVSCTPSTQTGAPVKMEPNALLVDVREASELADGMIKGALWMPTSKISESSQEWKAFLAKLPSGDAKMKTPVYVYCRSGARSGSVVALLKPLGFRAENAGGFSELKRSGLPVTVGPETP